MPSALTSAFARPAARHRRRTGVALAFAKLLARALGDLGVLAADFVELLLLELFEIEQRIVRTARRANELVELDLYRGAVAVLRVLDEEHHEESDDCRAGVDHELPRVAETEERARDRPYGNGSHRKPERERTPGRARDPLRESRKPGGRLRDLHTISRV